MKRALLLTAAFLVMSGGAHAQTAPIDTIVQTFQTASNGWQAGLQNIARNTFGILAIIQLFWSMARLVFAMPTSLNLRPSW